MLTKELDFFLEHQEEFAAQHYGEYVAISDSNVIGFFDSEKDAYIASLREHKLGTFLIRQCVHTTENVTQVFHSRAVFA